MLFYKYNFFGINHEKTGQRIRELRKASGFTVNQIAEMLETSEVAVYKWQNGSAIPSLENMLILSRIFEVPIEEIVVENEECEKFDDWEYYLK